MDYKKRITDEFLKIKLEAFGAALIVGPKGCGKTTTAKQLARTLIEFEDEDNRESLLKVAETMPSKLLKGEKPILFDEWQDAPKIWGAIRKSIDDTGDVGMYILTGSSAQDIATTHTGTMRISRLTMLPMSLYESNESNGEVSLIDLFNDPSSFEDCISNLTIDELIFAICRGGWPRSLNLKSDKAKLEIAKDLFVQTYSVDISRISKTKRNPLIAQAILRSYSRNICTLAETKTIYGDVSANYNLSEATYYSYLEDLNKLYIVNDIEPWCPAIRSKTVIRSSNKRNLIDPSIAVAAMGISPEYFDRDFKTLGFLFESLCIRDLKIYSQSFDGKVSYYRDRYGLEADCVLHLNDGRYALIEFKLGESEIDEGARHLCEIEKLVKVYNESEKQCKLRLPDLKIVITGTKYGYKRKDGVFVIPIGCLKN